MPEVVRVSWSVGDKMLKWKPAADIRPSGTHGWATLAKMRKECCYGQKNLGQYVAVCSRLQLTSHTQPTSTLSRIKCERYIFIKKCVSSFVHWRSYIMFDYVSAYICICICMQLYNNSAVVKRGVLTPLQKCSRHILKSQATGGGLQGLVIRKFF